MLRGLYTSETPSMVVHKEMKSFVINEVCHPNLPELQTTTNTTSTPMALDVPCRIFNLPGILKMKITECCLKVRVSLSTTTTTRTVEKNSIRIFLASQRFYTLTELYSKLY